MFHEIGFLLLQGALLCWPEGQTCEKPKQPFTVYREADLTSPAEKITPESMKDFGLIEVQYEVSGAPVYAEKKGGWYQLQKKNGQKLWINNSLEKDLQYESLENVMSSSLIGAGPSMLSELRAEDLKTPAPLPAGTEDKLRKLRFDSYLAEIKFALPVAFLECKSGSAKAHELPDEKSPVTINASLSFAHLDAMKPDPADLLNTKILVYDIRGTWVKVAISFNPDQRKFAWINQKNIPQSSVKALPEADRKKSLLVYFEEQHPMISRNLKGLDETGVLGTQSTGKTKWDDGILWVEINVMDAPECEGEQKPIHKAWLPFKKKSGESIIGWSSRGC